MQRGITVGGGEVVGEEHIAIGNRSRQGGMHCKLGARWSGRDVL